MPSNKQPNMTNISVMSLEITQFEESALIIEPESGDIYDDSFLIKCIKPLSIQKNKTLVLRGGFSIGTPQPIDSVDDTKVVTSPYHIEWKVEPNMDLLIESNIWVYGSSGSIVNPELKLILFNMGSGIFNTVKGTVIATLQFYLVPKLQIKRFKIS